MLTVRAAAQLLQRSGDAGALAAVARCCAIGGEPVLLDDRARDGLGLPRLLTAVQVASGGGALRALIAEVRDDSPLREVASVVARALDRSSPHLLWLLLLCRREPDDTAIVAWDGGRRSPRLVALHVGRSRIVDSDAEALCAMASIRDGEDLSRHARWLEILGREALSLRFYRLLEALVAQMAAGAAGDAPPAVRRELALLCASRLLFLAFLQAKGWLDGDRDFLARLYADAMLAGGSCHARVLKPLFFGTLNTPPPRRAAAARRFGRVPFLNGGLFSRTPLEKRWPGVRFTDESLGRLHGDLFAHYRFTAREDSSTWSEAAVDPEMLGRAFECLMADGDRKASGAFYTPQRIVDRLTTDALNAALGTDVTLERVRALRVLDPACGSGAFLVHVLERVAGLRAELGDRGTVTHLRRDVLLRGIFGVDVNPTAVWLCELRLWLSVVIDSEVADPLEVPPLPNLDRNVRVGDALSGTGFAEPHVADGRAVQRLRQRYVRAVGTRKRTVLAALEREERRLAIRLLDREHARFVTLRRERLREARATDLWGERARPTAALRAELRDLRARARSCAAARASLSAGAALPFSFGSHFADASCQGGFDIVIGNPPWVRVHRIPERQRKSLKRRYEVFRDAAWEPGAQAACAGTGFAGQVDLASIFVERALQLTRPGGTFALLVPAKLLRTLAGGGVRRLLTRRASLRVLEDYSAGSSLFDAAVYPAAVVATNDVAPRDVRATVHRRGGAVQWSMDPVALRFDETPGSPLLLVPPAARAAFDAVRAKAIPLVSSPLGRPTLGVKSGCNEAFLVPGEAGGRVPLPEGALRPALRGEELRAWRGEATDQSILWTHQVDGSVLPELPAGMRNWLAPWRSRLLARSDLRHGDRWWTLFRTEAASPARHRVVWADFARTPRAALLPRGDPTVPLNTCYVVACDDAIDAQGLCALLNSPLAAAWLAILAEPARGGYRRYLGWTVAMLPIPLNWKEARNALADAARRAADGRIPAGDELTMLASRAYGLDAESVLPLLEWSER